MSIIVIMAAFVLPFTRASLNAMNLTSDARNLSSAVSQAKMRAAAFFTQARLRVNLTARTYRTERWRKSPAGWVQEGSETPLSPQAMFTFSGLAAPPPNTQAAIGQAAACLDDAGNAIAGSACIVFNSRGTPIDNTNAPTAAGAFYISDGSVVFGVTASAGGLVRLWRSNVYGGAAWNLF